MPYNFQNMDLSTNSFNIIYICNFTLIQNFNGHLNNKIVY